MNSKFKKYYRKISKEADKVVIRKSQADHINSNLEILSKYSESEFGYIHNRNALEKDPVYKKLSYLHKRFGIVGWNTGIKKYNQYQKIVGESMKKMEERTMAEKEYDTIRFNSLEDLEKMIQSGIWAWYTVGSK